MPKPVITRSFSSVLVVKVNGNSHIKYTREIIAAMIREFGASKTQDTIQALYDNDRIDQNTAGFLLDEVKMFCGRKQTERMFLL